MRGQIEFRPWRSMSKRCPGCGWLFSVPAEQEDRTRCHACESRRDHWRQIGTFLSGADEATAGGARTAELPRGQSGGGGCLPESPRFPGGIDDVEF